MNMNNKEECEIVQDLLINYADNLLNPESKKLVEKHLIRCKECENMLLQIKDDLKEKNNDHNNKENIEIDYLRKLRIKSKIKSILIALCVIFILFFTYYFIKFIKINSIMNKKDKYSKETNYYREIVTSYEDKATSIKRYYKDGKYKEVMESYTDNGVEKFMERYGSKDSNEIITINFIDNTVLIENGNTAETINKAIQSNGEQHRSLIDRIKMSFTASIRIDNYDIGKDYYVLKDYSDNNYRNENWIDKETGLLIRRITKNSVKTYFSGTNVMKNASDCIEEYKYEFGNVTDDDVRIPDLSNYQVRRDDTLNNLINKANDN